MLTIKDRLIRYISTTGEGQGKFEKKCGLPNGFVSNIKEGISTGSLLKIYNACQELNIEWLVTGVGEMGKSEEPSPVTKWAIPSEYSREKYPVPYFNIEFKGMIHSFKIERGEEPSGFIDLPAFKDVDCWVNVTDLTMEPVVSKGDIIALKEIRDLDNSIMYGEIYAIVMKEIKIIKKIMPSQMGEQYIRVEAIDSTLYPPKEIRRDCVLKIYKVMGSIKQMM